MKQQRLQIQPVFVQRGAALKTWLTGFGVLILAAVATLGTVWGGPKLGDHEAIVAECARTMRLTGDWVVPQYLDTIWARKPPLPYWLVAAASYVFPNDPSTGLPVTTTAARLPTAVSAFLTILLLWHLAASMFGGRAGMTTAVVCSASVFFLLYSANATPEMLLTFCCTWAFVHFWHGVNTQRTWARPVHMMLFYVALGAGMLAKGPLPIVLTALPLAVWWYTERPLRLLAALGLGGWRSVLALFGRQIPRQTGRAFTRLYLVPGIIVFAAMFVPWMIAVGLRHPDAWDIWNWQYWQRAQNNYEDTRVRGPFYYLPIIVGLVLPWVFLLVEAAAAPWLQRYARQRRGLLYAGLWAVVGLAAMSMFAFKKPYYIAPAVPGLLLMIGLVADRFYAFVPTTLPVKINLWFGRWHQATITDPLWFAWLTWLIVAVAAIIMLVFGNFWMREHLPEVAMALTVIVAAAMVVLLGAGLLYVQGRGRAALAVTAVGVIAAFHTGWYLCGPTLSRESYDAVRRLDRVFDDAGVPDAARIYWADSRPDARLSFYFGRQPRYTLTPDEVVEFIGVNRKKPGIKDLLEDYAIKRADERLAGPDTVFLVVRYKRYDDAASRIKTPAYDVARVVYNPRDPGQDWMVVSNRPPRPAASQPSTQPIK